MATRRIVIARALCWRARVRQADPEVVVVTGVAVHAVRRAIIEIIVPTVNLRVMESVPGRISIPRLIDVPHEYFDLRIRWVLRNT